MKTKVSRHTLSACFFLPLPQATTETHRALEPSSQNESGPLSWGARISPLCQTVALLLDSTLHLAPWRPRSKTGFPGEGCGFQTVASLKTHPRPMFDAEREDGSRVPLEDFRMTQSVQPGALCSVSVPQDPLHVQWRIQG